VENVYMTRFVQCVTQWTSSMKGVAFLVICVITPLWTHVNTTTPSKPKEISLLLISSMVGPPLTINDFRITLIKLSTVPPLTNLSKCNNMGMYLKLEVYVNANLWLIINHRHFIAIKSKIPSCMNIHFSCNENNDMHRFYNFPTSIIVLMFL
jgi:hypothetical protein